MHHFVPNPFAVLEFVSVWRLVAAVFFGALIGFERSIAGKHAGMRTYALVSLGAALFVVVGTLASYQLSFFPGVNPLQIAGSIVIGIGFIGSGLAMFNGQQPVELTTAAGIWVAAGVGMAAGFGLFIVALGATALSIVVFSLLTYIEKGAQKRWGDFHPESK